MKHVTKRVSIASVFAVALFSSAIAKSDANLFETYPNLSKHLYREPDSPWRLGLGISPIGVLKSKLHFAFSFLQVHHMSEWFDAELFSVSLGFTQTRTDEQTSRHFLVRTAPKVRLFKFISLGPIGGYEFVTFPNIEMRLTKDGYYSPYESFSTKGPIYGIALSESFPYGENLIKISQNLYRQTFSVEKSDLNWYYDFKNTNLAMGKRDEIAPGYVFALEISFLF